MHQQALKSLVCAQGQLWRGAAMKPGIRLLRKQLRLKRQTREVSLGSLSLAQELCLGFRTWFWFQLVVGTPVPRHLPCWSCHWGDDLTSWLSFGPDFSLWICLVITELLVEPWCSQETWSALPVWLLWDCVLAGEDTATLPALHSA